MGIEGLFLTIFLGVFAFIIGWMVGGRGLNKFRQEK